MSQQDNKPTGNQGKPSDQGAPKLLSATQMELPNGRTIDLQNMSTADGVALYNSFAPGSDERKQADQVVDFVRRYNGTFDVGLPTGLSLQNALKLANGASDATNQLTGAAFDHVKSLLGDQAEKHVPGGKEAGYLGEFLSGAKAGAGDLVASPFTGYDALTGTAGEKWRQFLSGHPYSKEQAEAIGAAYAAALLKQEVAQKNVAKDAGILTNPLAWGGAAMDYAFINDPTGIWSFFTTLFRYIAGLWHEFVDKAPAPVWGSIAQGVKEDVDATKKAKGTAFHDLFTNRVAGEYKDQAVETLAQAGTIADVDVTPIAKLMKDGGQMYDNNGHIDDVAPNGATPVLTPVRNPQTGQPITSNQRIAGLWSKMTSYDPGEGANTAKQVIYGIGYPSGIVGTAALGTAAVKKLNDKFDLPHQGRNILLGTRHVGSAVGHGSLAGAAKYAGAKLSDPRTLGWVPGRARGVHNQLYQAQEDLKNLEGDRDSLKLQEIAAKERLQAANERADAATGRIEKIRAGTAQIRAKSALKKIEDKLEGVEDKLLAQKPLAEQKAALEAERTPMAERMTAAEARLAAAKNPAATNLDSIAERGKAEVEYQAAKWNLGKIDKKIKGVDDRMKAKDPLLQQKSDLEAKKAQAEQDVAKAEQDIKAAKAAKQPRAEAVARGVRDNAQGRIENFDKAIGAVDKSLIKHEDVPQKMERLKTEVAAKVDGAGPIRRTRVKVGQWLSKQGNAIEIHGDKSLKNIARLSGAPEEEIALTTMRSSGLGRFSLKGGKISGAGGWIGAIIMLIPAGIAAFSSGADAATEYDKTPGDKHRPSKTQAVAVAAVKEGGRTLGSYIGLPDFFAGRYRRGLTSIVDTFTFDAFGETATLDQQNKWDAIQKLHDNDINDLIASIPLNGKKTGNPDIDRILDLRALEANCHAHNKPALVEIKRSLAAKLNPDSDPYSSTSTDIAPATRPSDNWSFSVIQVEKAMQDAAKSFLADNGVESVGAVKQFFGTEQTLVQAQPQKPVTLTANVPGSLGAPHPGLEKAVTAKVVDTSTLMQQQALAKGGQQLAMANVRSTHMVGVGIITPSGNPSSSGPKTPAAAMYPIA